MEFDNLLDVCSMLPIGGGQKCFAEPEACLKMMGNGLFRHLLPSDEDTEGLEGMCVGIAGCKSEQALISLPRRRSSVGGEGVLQFNGCIPVGTEFSLGSSECILCSKCGVELHVKSHSRRTCFSTIRSLGSLDFSWSGMSVFWFSMSLIQHADSAVLFCIIWLNRMKSDVSSSPFVYLISQTQSIGHLPFSRVSVTLFASSQITMSGCAYDFSASKT